MSVGSARASVLEETAGVPVPQTCLTRAPLPTEHLILEWAWEMGPLSEPVSIGLPDPLKAGEDPKHEDYGPGEERAEET